MSKYKPVRYEQLISVAKRVLLTIQVAKIDGLLNKGNEVKVRGMNSRLYLYGGTAPSDLNKLLTWHEMHKMRKLWMDKLFPYFEPFIPGLTRKAMWEAIKERRKNYINDRTKKRHRKESREEKRIDPYLEFIDCKGETHRDKHPRVRVTPGFERLFPLPGHKYVEFIAKIDMERRAHLENCAHLDFDTRWGSAVLDLGVVKLRFLNEFVNRNQFAVADSYYCWGWGIDFAIVVTKGRLFIESGPGGLDYITSRGYITSKALEEINAKKKETETTDVGESAEVS